MPYTVETYKEKRKNNKDYLIDFDKFNRILSLELNEKSKENVLRGIKELEKRPEILVAEPDKEIKTASIPDDNKISEQWALNNIKAYDTWNIVNDTSQIIVGVLDTGIDGTHEDLKDNIYKSSSDDDISHMDFTTDKTFGDRVLTPTDPNGHGTHVAGIIGAKGNNKIGVTGMCWNVKLVSLRVIAENIQNKQAWFTRAVDYANNKNIPILNCSFGGYEDNW